MSSSFFLFCFAPNRHDAVCAVKRGGQYLSHHISVQRLISLNSMRIIIAVFEDVPFLGLNMFLLLRQPHLANNLVFMVKF